MPEAEVNGIGLYYEFKGSGEPLALVHGSWGDATSWGLVAGLAESFRVLAYDRRGHSRSERADTPGSVDEDGDDLAALLEALDLAPAHVATNSWGGNIALRLATRRPDVFRSLSVMSRRCGACSRTTPKARRCCRRAPAAWARSGSMSPRAITRARPPPSSSRRSPWGLAPGRTDCRPRYGRSSCRTPRPIALITVTAAHVNRAAPRSHAQ